MSLHLIAACVLSAVPAPPAPYKAVITIVVDQLGAEVFKKRLPFVAPTGGFARLQKEGVYVESMEFIHAITETAPGHAALYTGGTPRENGIISNDMPNEQGKIVSFLADSRTHLVGQMGVLQEVGASAHRLRLPTVAERLTARRPEARIVSFSGKDRAAILPLGRAKGEAVWLSLGLGEMVTSSQIAQLLWPYTINVQTFLNQHRKAIWQSGPLPAGAPATPDDQEGEADFRGFGRVFPHRYAAPGKEFGYAFRASPGVDEVVLGLASATVREDYPPQLLMLSFSANDGAGHLFGPDSREAWDVFTKLDAGLGKFFTLLDQRYGKDGWAAMLTADHGITSLPELGAAGPRVSETALEQTLNKIIAIDLGGDKKWVTVSEPYVWLSSAARGQKPAARAQIEAVVEKALLGTAGIETVLNVKNFTQECTPDADISLPALVCRSVDPERSGEFYIVLKKGAQWQMPEVPSGGVNHGSPWISERSVPLFVRAPGKVKPGSTVGVTGFRSFARTMADLLGVPAPAVAAKAASFAN